MASIKAQKTTSEIEVMEPYKTPTLRKHYRTSNEKIEYITRCLNNIVETALKTDCTHIFFVDADVVLPLDALSRVAGNTANMRPAN